MKKRSTGKRILAFVCALVISLGVALHGNAITARAELGVEFNGKFYTPEMLEEYKSDVTAYFNSRGLPELTQGYIDDFSQYVEDVKAGRIVGSSSVTAIPPEPPKSQEEIVMEQFAQELRVPVQANDSNRNKVLSLGSYCSLSNKLMKKVANAASKGYNVAVQYRYEGRNYVVLIPAGTEVDLSVEWAGPLYLASKYTDITDAWYAQNKKLCPELKLQNVINGVVE